jgi:hypothetical protein
MIDICEKDCNYIRHYNKITSDINKERIKRLNPKYLFILIKIIKTIIFLTTMPKRMYVKVNYNYMENYLFHNH